MRDPGDVTDFPSPAVVRSEIADASSAYGVPQDVLTYVWNIEAGGAADPAQEVGYNSAGYGGFYGLPQSKLGSVREQTRTTASLLATYYAQTGSWGAAMNIYNTGQPDRGYGSQYDSGVTMTRSTVANTPTTIPDDAKASADAQKIANAVADPPALVQLPTVSFPTLPDPHLALRAEGAVADRIVPMLVIGAAILLVIVVVMESV